MRCSSVTFSPIDKGCEKAYTNKKGGMAMSFSQYFPIWDKMTKEQQNRITGAIEFRKVPKGTLLHNGDMDCLGLLLIRSGQVRVYIFLYNYGYNSSYVKIFVKV